MQSSGVSFVGVVGRSASQAIGEEECAEMDAKIDPGGVEHVGDMQIEQHLSHSGLHLSAPSIVHLTLVIHVRSWPIRIDNMMHYLN
jgi:hypothetical protein